MADGLTKPVKIGIFTPIHATIAAVDNEVATATIGGDDRRRILMRTVPEN